jgi:hypothetical protein
MKTGWLGIVAGVCFVGVVAVSLLGERAVSAPGAPNLASTGDSSAEALPYDAPDPTALPDGADEPGQKRRGPDDRPNVVEVLALLRDSDSHGTRGVRTGRACFPRTMPVRNSTHQAPGDQQPVWLVDPLERVVFEARCTTTTLRVEAPLLHAHAPPVWS